MEKWERGEETNEEETEVLEITALDMLQLSFPQLWIHRALKVQETLAIILPTSSLSLTKFYRWEKLYDVVKKKETKQILLQVSQSASN